MEVASLGGRAPQVVEVISRMHATLAKRELTGKSWHWGRLSFILPAAPNDEFIPVILRTKGLYRDGTDGRLYALPIRGLRIVE